MKELNGTIRIITFGDVLIIPYTTAKGLKVTCRLDRRKYPTGRKVSDEEMKRINVEHNKFHGDWNYVIRPEAKEKS